MKIGLITQIRDEIDIVETFVAHVDSLFDTVYFIDHQSIDGSGEYLSCIASQRPGWRYYILDSKTKLQTAAINFLLHEIFNEGVDYLFLLDGDEFIDIQSRAALEDLINDKLLPNDLGSLRWKNCICNSFKNTKFSQTSRIWVPPENSLFEKVVLTRKFYSNHKNRFKVSAGNHSVTVSDNFQAPTKTNIGNIIHIPIRSTKQVIKKVLTTVIAYRGYKKREPSNSFQYYDMLKKVSDGKMMSDDLRGYTLGFEYPAKTNLSVSKADLKKLGYRQSTLTMMNISFSSGLPCTASKVTIPLERMLANALLNLETNLPEDIQLRVDGNILRIANFGLDNADSWSNYEGVDSSYELSNQINALETELAILKTEVKRYENSKSWKITKPIRLIVKIFRRKYQGTDNS